MAFIGTRLFLNNLCTIKREGFSTDSLNRPVSSGLTTISTDTRCRLIQKNKVEFIDGKQVIVSQHLLYLPHDTDIEQKDNVTIAELTYSVEAIDKNPGNASHHIEVMLQHIGPQ